MRFEDLRAPIVGLSGKPFPDPESPTGNYIVPQMFNDIWVSKGLFPSKFLCIDRSLVQARNLASHASRRPRLVLSASMLEIGHFDVTFSERCWCCRFEDGLTPDDKKVRLASKWQEIECKIQWQLNSIRWRSKIELDYALGYKGRRLGEEQPLWSKSSRFHSQRDKFLNGRRVVSNCFCVSSPFSLPSPHLSVLLSLS